MMCYYDYIFDIAIHKLYLEASFLAGMFKV